MEEISPQHLPFLFRISEPNQRLTIHKNGVIDRVMGAQMPVKVLFLSEELDSKRQLFGEVGVLTRFDDGYVVVQVENKEERTDLGKICDMESALLEDAQADLNFRCGGSVTIVEGDDRLCGCVVGVLRLPWQEEDVVIVQHLMDEPRGAVVPVEILKHFPAEQRHRTAGYRASTVKKCQFFICNEDFECYDQRVEIQKGSLLTKDCDETFFFLEFALYLGRQYRLRTWLEEISSQELPFLFRIEDSNQRFTVHRSGLVKRVLGAELPLKNILFLLKGYDVVRWTVGNLGNITAFGNGLAHVQVEGKTHATTLENVLILDNEKKSEWLPESHEEINLGDIVECDKDKKIRTIHAIQKFPGKVEPLVVMKHFGNEKDTSEVAICFLKSLKKVGDSARNNSPAQNVDDDDDFEKIDLPAPGSDLNPYKTENVRVMPSKAEYEPMEIDQQSDEDCNVADDFHKTEFWNKKEVRSRAVRSTSVESSTEDEDRGDRVEAHNKIPSEAAETEKKRRASAERPKTGSANEDHSSQTTDSYEIKAIEDFPIDSRVFFVDDSSSPKSFAGTVKWTGKLRIVYTGSLLAVVVLDERHSDGTNGCFSGVRLITCPSGRAMLIGVDRLHKMPRICVGDVIETLHEPKDKGLVVKMDEKTVTVDMNYDSSVVYKIFKIHEVRKVGREGREGAFSPWRMKVTGENRGIQGEGNSCYLDSLLFSLFAFSDVAKKKIENTKKKSKWYQSTYDSLISKIANTLRTKGYVQHAVVKDLRQLMAAASREEKFKDSARDISECMETLFQNMLQMDPFVFIRSLNNETGTFVVDTLLVEGVVGRVTSQLCLEYAALNMDFVISKVDDCLMIQLPRDRNNSSIVVPSKSLDLKWCEGINEGSRCSRCNHLCVTHVDNSLFDRQGLCSTFLCAICAKFRQGATKSNFLLKGVSYEGAIPELHLSAVICIERSHYNCFVRTGSNTNPKWVFFDSMADQKNETKNISKLIEVDVDDWIDEALAVDNFDIFKTKLRPEVPTDLYRRLFQYPYMFIYHT